MRTVILIARRELAAFLCSPTGLVLVGLYLALAGYFFWIILTATEEATLRYTFGLLAQLMVFIVPLITMRLLAEELRTGTFEVLVTNPVTDGQIVVGKFLAGWCCFLIMSAPTLTYLVVLRLVGAPDWGPALAGFLGQALLAALLVSIGVLASAATQNQVLAAMGAMVGGVLFWLAGQAAASLRGRLSDAVAYLAMFEHFGQFSRGVIDTRSLIFFLGTTAMFLFLAVRVVESRRWKVGVSAEGPVPWRHTGWSLGMAAVALLVLIELMASSAMGSAGTRRQLLLLLVAGALLAVPITLNRQRLRYELGRRQAGMALTVAVNSLLVIIIWASATYITSRYFQRIDLTSIKRYALSEQTLHVLSSLTAPVEIFSAVNSPRDLAIEVRDLLSEYTARTNAVIVQHIDPVRNPTEAETLRRRFGFSSNISNELVVAVGDQARRLPAQALFRVPERIVDGRRRAGAPFFVGEAELTGAIVRLTRATPGTIVFLAGHGERDPDSNAEEGAAIAASQLRGAGWTVTKQVITPGAGAAFPPDTQVVVIAGPRSPVSDEVVAALNGVVDRGGGVLVLLDPNVEANLDSFLYPWDVRIKDTMVLDPKQFVGANDPTSLYVTTFRSDHPIGKGMGTLAAVLPLARRIAVAGSDMNPHVTTVNFMHTSKEGWAVPFQAGDRVRINQDTDVKGNISLGLACERYQERGPGETPLQGRVVVIGDSDFVSNRYVDNAGNLTLFLNAVEWLAGRQDLIGVRPKATDARIATLTEAGRRAVFWWSVLIVPAASVGLGFFGLVRQRMAT